MQDNEASVAPSLRRGPWNKGKLVGAKPPLRPKHVWSISKGGWQGGWKG
jgi:hypothetical protein